MAKFVPKASEVEAIQLDISKAKKEWQLVAVPDGGVNRVKAMVPGIGLAGDGDYIVKDGKDSYVLSAEDFEGLYKPAKK